MSHQSDLPPHVPSCVSTGAGVEVPDATTTPRTIEQAAQDCLTNLECNNYGFAEACAIIASAMREVVERELSSAQAALTAAKAEIAGLNENLDRLTCVSVDARARVADLENDLEKSKHEADDWHRAWETVTEQAKKEVAELEQDRARHLTILKEAHEKIQNYAKRQGKTRMAGKSFNEGTVRNTQAGQHYPAIQSLIGSINTALAAARAGKGAT